MISIGRFAHQVEFIQQGFLKFLHHFARPQLLARDPVTFDLAGDDIQQADITLNDRQNSRAQYLDHDLAVILERGAVHLGNGGRGKRSGLKISKNVFDAAAETGFNNFARLGIGKRWDLVL